MRVEIPAHCLMRAFADESFGWFRSLSTYVMCAALIEDSELEGIRLAMRRLRKGSTKLHWYEESDKRRHLLLAAMGDLDMEFAISHQTASESLQTSMRRACLQQLGRQLAQRGIQHLTLESRNRTDDRRDILDINWIRQSEGASVWLQHVRGADEPILWAADLICGASLARLRGDEAYNRLLNKLRITHA